MDNYRHISCLSLLWKLLTGIISEHLCKRRYYPKNKRVVKEIAEEIKISYYWTKQSLETAKGEAQTWQ